MGDWSRLPKKLLEMIAAELEDCIVDYIQFGAVCSSWRSIAVEKRHQINSQTPWLLFPISPIEKTHYDSYTRPDKKTRYGLLNLSNEKVYFLDLPKEISNTHFCIGAYQSWLLMSDEDNMSFLLNPFTGSQVQIPWKKIAVLSVSKFVFSSSLATHTMEEDFTVMAIHGSKKKLAFCKPGDENWTRIEGDNDPYVDLMYYEGQFYALDQNGGVIVVCFGGPSPSTKLIKIQEAGSSSRYHLDYNYLVGSCGKLLLVKRIYNMDQTIGFKVFELDTSNRELVEVSQLGDRVLFVGDNFSTSILSLNSSKCRGNCIYFADYYKKFPLVFHDIAAFDLCDTSIEHLRYGRGVLDIGTSFLQGEAVWVTPSPCF
ncbi:hypothetical protein L1049_018271 [Liquidambar formosana]|uniref:KIB1-4 beta-propeller domain-containing protein n=1 Tax=Liquidambar formosana TaxID=63359 RepID=A0AAP0WMM2_LIQFO